MSLWLHSIPHTTVVNLKLGVAVTEYLLHRELDGCRTVLMCCGV